MLSSSLKESFISLIKLGLGHSAEYISCENDWSAIEALSAEQGLSAVIIDGIECIPDSKRPPKVILLNWIGNVLQSFEYRYEAYCKTIAELAAWYNTHGFKMMVLKGYSCSLDWPKPEHRPCGDIDIWLFGKQKEADVILEDETQIKVDKSEHHHTVIYWGNFMVENHYDFINVHHHKSNADFERILKELGQDDRHSVVLYGEKMYLPSPDLHALFLLKHMMMHFAAESISLRQLVDWGFFVEKHGKDVNWEWLEVILDRFGMKQMFNVFNAVCVGDLGFDVKLFPQVQYDPKVKDRVLNEILFPEFSAQLPKGLLKRVIYKFRRWYKSDWKHKLCYKESMWESFWSGVWMHLLKPGQI